MTEVPSQEGSLQRGFLAVMWPKLVTFLALLILWVAFLRWYF